MTATVCSLEDPDMAEPTNEFAVLMEQVRAGDQEAARILYERYNQPVLRVVRYQLAKSMRRQYDSEDFSQAVWSSFFVEVAAETCTFANPDALVAFLAQVAYHKVISTTRKRQQTQRRGSGGSVSLDAVPEGEDKKPLGQTLPAPTPTPSQFVMAEERYQHLLENLPPGHRRILKLLREGYSKAQIADILKFDPKTIRRVIDRVEELWLNSDTGPG
jgi:RNA polymerase sigma factor (sigma-70 family)